MSSHKKCADVLADMLFAYINKDEVIPHDFEITAIENAVEYLNKHYKGTKFSKKWFTEFLHEFKLLHDPSYNEQIDQKNINKNNANKPNIKLIE